PALPVAILATGRVDAHLRRIVAERRVGATGGGEVLAPGVLVLPPAGGPGLALGVDVRMPPASPAKRPRPGLAGAPARHWTLKNVYGGVVKRGSLNIDLPAGRVGNGVPLGPPELSGRFEVHGARFDMAGSIPPMRDAVGIVDISGKDVDIG